MTTATGFDAEAYLSTWRLDDNGQFEQVLRRLAGGALRPALFLDRDGVIVEDVHHLRRPDDVRMMADAASLIAAANRACVPVVVITNQSGVGQGLFTWADFLAVQVRILSALAAEGATVDAVFACPNHPDAQPPHRHPDHPCRKPNPGMLRRAAARLPIDLAQSWIVGDRWRDLEAGRRAGLAGGLYVGIPRGEDGVGNGDAAERRAAEAIAADPGFAWHHGRSIADAAGLPLLNRPAPLR